MEKKFVTYLRVSTTAQGQSGLGLEAQKKAVESYLSSVGGRSLAEFVEVESGRKNERVELQAALSLCKAYGATLLVAKLDRLARNAHFLLGLQEAYVDFVAADNPNANKLTVGILAIVAQNEAEAISQRTKAALQAAKARGVTLGGFRGYVPSTEDREKASRARTEASRAKAELLRPILKSIDPDACMSLTETAKQLNARGVPTVSGKGRWNSATVKRVYTKLAA